MNREQAKIQLQQALKRLYQVFRQYPGKPGWGDGYDDLRSLVREERPESVPVNELTPEAFSYFSGHSVCSLGSVVDAIKYFLPRILEYHSNPDGLDHQHERLIDKPGSHKSFSHRNSGTLEMEMLVRDMVKEKWSTWPEAERKAIEDWFGAVFDFALAEVDLDPRYSSLQRISDILRWAGCLGMDLNPLLQRLWIDERVTTQRMLAGLIIEHWPGLVDSGKPVDWDEYWGHEDHAPDQTCEQLSLWIMRREVRDRFEQAFFQSNGGDDGQTWSDVVYAWDNIDAMWRQADPRKGWPAWVLRYREEHS